MKLAFLVLSWGMFLWACKGDVPREGTTEEGVYTIAQIQDWKAPARPAIGELVKIEHAIVTAIDSYDEDGQGRVGNIWVGEASHLGVTVCGPFCGIMVYKPEVVPELASLTVGDIVALTGIYDEFLYNDDPQWYPDPSDPFPYHFSHLSEIHSGRVVKIGEWLPLAPVEVDAMEVQMEPVALQAKELAESYEGVLVTVRNLTIASEYDRYGQLTTEQGVMIEDDLFRYPCPGYSGSLRGVHLDSVSGVVSWFGIRGLFGNYKILPRGPDDFSPRPDFPECQE